MYIAHRGNLEGRIAEHENDPVYLQEAIDEGYMVEVDLWNIDGQLKLGHDEKFHDVTFDWLLERKPFILNHCKNREALDTTLRGHLHAFWHTDEDYVLTTFGYVKNVFIE